MVIELISEWLGTNYATDIPTTEVEPFDGAYNDSRDGYLVSNNSQTATLYVHNVTGKVAAATRKGRYVIGPGETKFVAFKAGDFFISSNATCPVEIQQVQLRREG